MPSQILSNLFRKIRYPLKPLLRFILQTYLGKFLLRPLNLTNEHLSREEIQLNNLEFDCRILNNMIDKALKDSQADEKNPFKIICFNVGKLKIKNWLNFKIAAKDQQDPIVVEIDEIDIYVMPMISDFTDKRPEFGKPKDIAELDSELKKIRKDGKKKNEQEEIGTIQKYMNEMMHKILPNIQINILNTAIRILTQEQIADNQKIPTFLVRIRGLSLIRRKKEHQKNNKLGKDDIKPSIEYLFFQDKDFYLGEISVHLMESAKIYEGDDYPEIPVFRQDSLMDSEQGISSLQCPWTYPLTNHPSTILLWTGANKAMRCSFRQQNHVDVKVSAIELKISIDHLKQIMNFVKIIDSAPQKGNSQDKIGIILPQQESSFQQQDPDLLSLEKELSQQSVQIQQQQPLPKKKHKNPLQILGTKIQLDHFKKEDLSKQEVVFIEKLTDKDQFFTDLKEHLEIEDEENSQNVDKLHQIPSNLEDQVDLDEDNLNLGNTGEQMENFSIQIEINLVSVEILAIQSRFDRNFKTEKPYFVQNPEDQVGYKFEIQHVQGKILREESQSTELQVNQVSQQNPFAQEISQDISLKTSQIIQQVQQRTEIKKKFLINAQFKNMQLTKTEGQENEDDHDDQESSYMFQSALDLNEDDSSNKNDQDEEEIEMDLVFGQIYNAQQFRGMALRGFWKGLVKQRTILGKMSIDFDFTNSNEIVNQKKSVFKMAKINQKDQIELNVTIDDLIFAMYIGTILKVENQNSIQNQDNQRQTVPFNLNFNNLKINLNFNKGAIQRLEVALKHFIDEQEIEIKKWCQIDSTYLSQQINLKIKQIQMSDTEILQLEGLKLGYNQQIDLLFVDHVTIKNRSKESSSEKVSESSEENYIIYEEDEDEDLFQNMDPPQLDKNESNQQTRAQNKKGEDDKSMVVDINQMIICIPVPQIMVVAKDLGPLFQGLMCMQDLIDMQKVQQPKRQEEDQSQIISINLNRLDFVVTKELNFVLAQIKLEGLSTQIELTKDQADSVCLSAQLQSILVFDMCQLPYKLYHKHQFQQNLFLDDNYLEDTCTDDDQIKYLCGLTICEVLQKYEHTVILCKHSQFLEGSANAINFEINVSFDLSNKITLDTSLFPKLQHKKTISDIFNQIGAFKQNPMKLGVKVHLKDIMIRVQPILSQKMDKERDKFREYINLSRSQHTKVGVAIQRQNFYNQTSLLKEVIEICKRLEQENDDQLQNVENPSKDIFKIEFQLKNTCIDIHPTINFKTFLDLFGEELQQKKKHLGQDYPTFDQTYQVKVSQRMVIISQELYSTLLLNNQTAQKSIKFTSNNLSMKLLDQKNEYSSLDELEKFNPIILIGGLGDRYPLRLNEGTPGVDNSSYLDSLGFQQILLLDFMEIQSSEEILSQEQVLEDQLMFENTFKPKVFKMFKVQVQVKKIAVHLARDSYKTLQILGECISQNSKQLEIPQGAITENQLNQMRAENQQLKLSQIQFEEEEIKEDFQVDFGDPRTIHEKFESFVHDCEEYHKKSMAQVDGFDELTKPEHNVFEINQINDKKMILRGCKSLDMWDPNFVSNDYISTSKKVDNKRKLMTYRKSHVVPVIYTQKYSHLNQAKNFLLTGKGMNKVKEDVSMYMQPKVELSLHIQAIDVKFFQSLDFDFLKQTHQFNDPRLASLEQSSHSTKKSRIIDSYFAENEKLVESMGALQHLNRQQEKKMTSYRRRRAVRYQGRCHQIILRNILITQFKMKDINFQKRQDLQELQLYKYYRWVVTVQKLSIRENISTQGTSMVDTFHLPYSYKYDYFCELQVGLENYVKFKQISIKLDVQPIKFKLKQDVLNFILEFLGQESQQAANQTQQEQLMKPMTQILTQSQELDKQKIMKALIKEKHMLTQSKMKKKAPVYVKDVQIKQTSISLSYSSKQLQIQDLLKQDGNKLEYLNVFNINDLQIIIKAYDQKGQRVTRKECREKLEEFYHEDIMNNQRYNIVSAIGPLKGILNISNAVYQVVRKPIQTSYDNGDAYRGFVESMHNFYSTMSEEGFNARKWISKTGSNMLQF